MVRSIRCQATEATCYGRRVAGRAVLLAVWWLSMATALPAQQPSVHYLHHGIMPPGAIGSQQLQRGGPLLGFYQPVEIKAPAGVSISLAVNQQFDDAQPAPRKAGFLIGAVYRLRVTNIHLAEGLEVFPTIEVIDRLYAPADQQRRFPIPIELTEEDLKLAIDGKFVTRVIYVEDPRHALPVRDNPESQIWFEASPGSDPLAVADELGRPVAILRMGARLPEPGETLSPNFCFGFPPFVALPSDVAPAQPIAPPAAPAVRNLPPPPVNLPPPPSQPVGDRHMSQNSRSREAWSS